MVVTAPDSFFKLYRLICKCLQYKVYNFKSLVCRGPIHPMIRKWICLFAVLAGFASPGLVHVQAIEIYTKAKQVEAVNGTSVKLHCTFKSTEPITEDSVSVTWSFRPLKAGKAGTEETVFHYREEPYPPMEGRFKGHAVWSGDAMNGDVSISLLDVQFSFNGTYSCEVRNPPDFQGFAGELVLKVVKKASVSEIGILAASVGGGIVVIVVLLAVVVVVRKRCRLKGDHEDHEDHEDQEVELKERKWKDPTVW